MSINAQRKERDRLASEWYQRGKRDGREELARQLRELLQIPDMALAEMTRERDTYKELVDGR